MTWLIGFEAGAFIGIILAAIVAAIISDYREMH
jgi:hypothetical protein